MNINCINQYCINQDCIKNLILMYPRTRSKNFRSNRRNRNRNRNENENENKNNYSKDSNNTQIMSSLNDRVMDDRSMNVTRYKRSLDVDRIMLERQMTMDGTSERYGKFKRDDFAEDGSGKIKRNQYSDDDYSDNNYSDNNYSDNNYSDNEYGEVTGKKIEGESDRFDHGMPVRSNFQTKKADFDQNSHLDFDLYDKDNKEHTSKNDRLYYSESGDGYFSELKEAMKPITEGTDPYETCITGVNTSSCWLNDNMASIMKRSYAVSGYALFSIMGTLYLLSENDISSDYVSYFEFQEKKKLNAGLLTIREKLNKYRDQIIVDNYIVSSSNYDLNKKTASGLKKLAFPVVVNSREARNETFRLNSMVKKISKMSNVFSEKTIKLIDSVSLVTVTKIRPIFQYAINDIIEESFYSNINTNTENKLEPIRSQFLRFVGITCGFFEDKTLRMIEMPLKGAEHVFGLIMRKDDNDKYGISDNKQNRGSIADIKKLSTCINYLEHRVMDEVTIPMVDKRFKIRLNTTLKNTGLRNVFRDPNYYRLYPDGAHISDCIQYTDLIISDYSVGEKSKNRGYMTQCKFFANTEFEFYVRDITTNTIFTMGKYVG